MDSWLSTTLVMLPLLLAIYLAVGLPWALTLLPRRDWTDRPLLLCLALALGPMLLTAWMFILGSLGPLLRLELILAGLLLIAGLGTVLAWRKRGVDSTSPDRRALAFDEKLLLILIAAALIVRLLAIGFWPFTAYDALWVYGYEGRLYSLLNQIPAQIAYYPQFLPLQYSFAQLLVGGIDDHAARAVIAITHLGSILAAYVLGSRLFTRRSGLFAAALWALYPHVGEWARFGDLEIPLTFLFTAAAAFFLLAWTQTEHRRRYALIAGLMLGAAMWTKPTAGAFIWGVLLLVAVELVRLRFDWHAWLPRFQVAVWTGLASIPLGAAWYIRNGLLGHHLIDFPPDFWLTQALRSGQEFGWPLLALLLFLAFLHFGPVSKRPGWQRSIIGLALILAGLLPSILQPQRMGLIEWALLVAGAAWLYRHLAGIIRPDERLTMLAGRIGWALLLALPYAITWFYSYSYHYRLSFPIVPLLLLPSAVILSEWLTPARVRSWRPIQRSVYVLLIAILALPGVFSALNDAAAGNDWLWSGELKDDIAKYAIGNDALLWVVDGLQKYIDEYPDDTLIVAAPNVQRLPFFFPLEDIRIDEAPTQWSELEGVTYFIESSPEGSGAYEGIPLRENQVLSGLSLAGSGIPNILRKAWWRDDGTFSYTVYELHLERRFENPNNLHDPETPVVFGDLVRYRGHGIGADTFWPGRPVYLQLYWESLAQAERDYTIFIHLRDEDGNVLATWDGPVSHSGDGNYYGTSLWEPGEFVRDERLLRFEDTRLPPVGEGYSIWIGFYDAETDERLPVTIGGEASGDDFRLNERLRVIAQEPG